MRSEPRYDEIPRNAGAPRGIAWRAQSGILGFL